MLPDEALVEEVTAQRCEIALGHPDDLADNPVDSLIAMGERVRMGVDAESLTAAIATAAERLARSARRCGLDWAGGVSDTAVQKFARDYVREVDGRQIVLGPHLRMSGGNRLLRIYCALDETPGPVGGPPVRRLIVGHVGEHLRDQGADD